MIDTKDIKTGDLLFLEGKTWLAKQIVKAQKAAGFKLFKLNHTGYFIWMNGVLCVAEEDFPGYFDINEFNEEYIKTKSNVYHGYIGELSDEQLVQLNKDTLKYAMSDRPNYAYLDILSFRLFATTKKWFGRGIWIGRKKNKKNKFTCSQITCKFVQDYYNIMRSVNYIECFPAQIADCPAVIISKINY